MDRAELYALLDALAQARRWTSKRFAEVRAKAREDEGAALERFRKETAELKLDTEKAALKDLRIHDLRRTFGSWQAATGASLTIIGASLGHKDVSTTQIYARLSVDPVREAVAKATTAMLAAGGLLPSAEVQQLSKKRFAP